MPANDHLQALALRPPPLLLLLQYQLLLESARARTLTETYCYPPVNRSNLSAQEGVTNLHASKRNEPAAAKCTIHMSICISTLQPISEAMSVGDRLARRSSTRVDLHLE